MIGEKQGKRELEKFAQKKKEMANNWDMYRSFVFGSIIAKKREENERTKKEREKQKNGKEE